MFKCACIQCRKCERQLICTVPIELYKICGFFFVLMVNLSCEFELMVITRAVIPAIKFHPFCHMKVVKQLHITALMTLFGVYYQQYSSLVR